jgi:hypothetical protein
MVVHKQNIYVKSYSRPIKSKVFWSNEYNCFVSIDKDGNYIVESGV